MDGLLQNFNLCFNGKSKLNKLTKNPKGKIFQNYSCLKQMKNFNASLVGMWCGLGGSSYNGYFWCWLEMQDGCHHGEILA